MTTLTQANFQQLVQAQPKPGVSFYFNVVRTGADSEMGRIQLKNLLAQAEEHLLQRGLDKSAIESLLAKPKGLLLDGTFWQKATTSIALFVADARMDIFALPYQVTDKVIVDDAFYVVPLLKALPQAEDFYILALSVENCHLLACTQSSCYPLFLQAIPRAMHEEFNYRGLEDHLQQHTSSMPKIRDFFHGHGGQKDMKKIDITAFFREVDRGLQDLFQVAERPLLVLAGTERHVQLFKDITHYPNIASKYVVGSPDSMSQQELFAQAQLCLVDDEQGKQLEEKLAASIAQGKGTLDLDEVVAAACNGRVEALVLKDDRELWGKFDADSTSSDAQHNDIPFDHELVNRTAIEALRHAGTVKIDTENILPRDVAMAATLRY